MASPEANETQSNKLDKIAMSKALGQAFLSHQVRQLEENTGSKKPPRRNFSGGTYNRTLNASNQRPKPGLVDVSRTTAPAPKAAPGPTPKKIIIDSSVLVHALDQVRKWCSADGTQQLIIPLEGKLFRVIHYI